jgi:hypothetical protein
MFAMRTPLGFFVIGEDKPAQRQVRRGNGLLQVYLREVAALRVRQ